MKALHVAMECYPFSKVGGMADVVGSLPAAQREAGVETQVLTPYYSQVYKGGDRSALGAELARFEIEIGGVSHPVRLLEGDEHTVLVEEPVAYDRPGIYDNPHTGVGFDDSLYRCLVLQQTARVALREGLLSADVVHCHDNHTGLLPVYLKDDGGPPSVFTIHNLAYQGIYSGDDFPITGLDASRFYGHSAIERSSNRAINQPPNQSGANGAGSVSCPHRKLQPPEKEP
jgi:starch synthase